MINILITGADGQLGAALKNVVSSVQGHEKMSAWSSIACAESRSFVEAHGSSVGMADPFNIANWSFIFTDKSELDITDYNSSEYYIKNHNIDYIINCAAYTNVDTAETEQDQTLLVNSQGPKNLAKLTDQYKVKLIHLSTDYVYSGELRATPYKETDSTRPINFYGYSKLLGELNIINNLKKYIIIRTSWLYYFTHKNFFTTIANLAEQKDSLNIVADQIGTPTYCGDLAVFILNIIKLDISNKNNNYFNNIYNFSNIGQISWYEFAKTIVELNHIDCKILPITTEQYPTKASRPKYSVLDKSKALAAFKYNIPGWQDSLKICIEHKKTLVEKI